MRKMRYSGVPWIGEIPEEWGISKIKSIFSISSGTTPRSEVPEFWDGDITWITPADFKSEDVYVRSGHRNISRMGMESCNLRIVPVDTVIFSKRAPIGQVALAGVPLCTNQGCLTAIAESDSDQRYYRYAMMVGTEEFENVASGTTFKEISAQAFGNIFFPRPNRCTQTCIANYLDNKCSKIDAIIAKQEQIIAKLKSYRTSFITETVTKGLDRKTPMRSSTINWISEIPCHWKEYRVANLYDQISESGNDVLPILSVSINTGISDRELSDEEQDRVFVRSEDRSKYKRVRPGDLAYNMMRAWQGAFGAVRVDGMVSPAYVTCRPKKNVEIDSRYIEYLFRTPIAIEEMHRFSHGVADFRLRLYWPEFKNIRLSLPPINEQREIADSIDRQNRTIDLEISRREAMIEKMKEYKKSLIYEVVTGKREV